MTTPTTKKPAHYFVLFFILFLVGCSAVNQAPEAAASPTRKEISFVSIDELSTCYVSKISAQGRLIKDEDTFDQAFEVVPTPECRAAIVSIDFIKYMLLGLHAQGGGCTIDFEKHVYKGDEKKEILYEVIVHEEGQCMRLWRSDNWILVEKFPEDYTVTFNVIEAR